MSKGLFKKAAVAIRGLMSQKDSLEEQVETLTTQLEKYASAKELSFKLFKMGLFPAEDLEEQFNLNLDRSKEDINSFEKAASVFTSFSTNLGSLSDKPSYNDDTAEERFLSSLLDD